MAKTTEVKKKQTQRKKIESLTLIDASGRREIDLHPHKAGLEIPVTPRVYILQSPEKALGVQVCSRKRIY